MSPRPRKERRCHGQYCGRAYKPSGIPLKELDHISMERDELEALRLCDLEGLFQEQAGIMMGVSRGTIQRILTSARKKVARAITTGSALVFELEEEVNPEKNDDFQDDNNHTR
ncbi:DUF134 domain-containing protein [Desulfogranum japonicum]|uniref:DUF134 domain-containing protein n=1 Tax=Desulfogranum japonicum TaxID=231447 RepID=UPI0004265291|nr:DUF134 domain-containing protein [Desulfogranum japonicum]